jgi:hypothetical protein
MRDREVFEEQHGLWNLKLWVSLSWLLTVLTLGNSLNFIDLCFLHLQNGDNNSTVHRR